MHGPSMAEVTLDKVVKKYGNTQVIHGVPGQVMLTLAAGMRHAH